MKKYLCSYHIPYNVFSVPAKRIKNITSVASNWLKKHEYLPEFVNRNSPRNVIFYLYMALRSREADVKQNEIEISRLKNINSGLRERILLLEEYEKAAVYKDYTFSITTVNWTCGDGCCSDSWAYYTVRDEKNQVVDGNNYCSGNTYRSKESLASELRKEYGKDIQISFYREDDDTKEIMEDYSS